MKRWLFTALLLALLVNLVWAAERKDPTKVQVDALTKDTQRTATAQGADGLKGMNLVWYVPLEFWQSTLLQNTQVTKAQANSMIDQMKGVLIVAVVRSQIHDMGQFEFYDENTVRKNLTLTYTGPDAKVITLAEQQDLTPGNAAILAAMKPMLQAAMGKMGQNMYFFVFKDVDAAGNRLVLPDSPGKLSVTLAPLPGEPGGKIDFEFPLNSLFVPRECPKCHHAGLDILWHFCPFCGEKLPA